MPDLTAAELADLTRPLWGEPWFKECGVVHDGGTWYFTAHAEPLISGEVAPPSVAYALIFNAAVRALPKYASLVNGGHDGKENHWFVVDVDGYTVPYESDDPDPLRAVIAAHMKIKETT